MAKEAIYQVRMDAEVKEQVELLYQRMGSSFAEAVRMLAAQSLHDQGMPFRPTVGGSNPFHGVSAYGIAAKRANPALMDQEKGAFAKAMVEKHATD